MADALLTRDELVREVRQLLVAAQNRMEQVYDKDHVERVFSEGEWVYLQLQGDWQHSIQKRHHHKLAPKFYGPYRIVTKISPVAYRLALHPKAKIHDVFHVSILKKRIGDGVPVQDHLPLVPEDSKLIPQAMLEHRHSHSHAEVVIHWKDFSPADATWESLSDLQLPFPDFALVDKGHFKCGGVLRTYVRRHKRMQDMQALQAADSAREEHDETLAATNPNPFFL
jgi:hypothetical protein